MNKKISINFSNTSQGMGLKTKGLIFWFLAIYIHIGKHLCRFNWMIFSQICEINAANDL